MPLYASSVPALRTPRYRLRLNGPVSARHARQRCSEASARGTARLEQCAAPEGCAVGAYMWQGVEVYVVLELFAVCWPGGKEIRVVASVAGGRQYAAVQRWQAHKGMCGWVCVGGCHNGKPER